MISALGAGLMLSTAAQFIWGPEVHPFPQLIDRVPIVLGGLAFSSHSLLILAISIVLVAGASWVLHKTKFGVAAQCVCQDIDAARLVGIPIEKVILAVYALGGFLGVAGGVLFAMYFNAVFIQMGLLATTKAWAAAMLGGIGSFQGAFLGRSDLLGLAETAAVATFGAAYRDGVSLGIIVLVLLIRPEQEGYSAPRPAERSWMSACTISSLTRRRAGGRCSLPCWPWLPLLLPGRFWPHILTITVIFAILALGQNIITGWCGMLTLGQAALRMVSAPTPRLLLTMNWGVPWLLAFLAAGLLSAVIGALLAIPCLRVRSDFLSLVTIAFNQIFFMVANNWDGRDARSDGPASGVPAMSDLSAGRDPQRRRSSSGSCSPLQALLYLAVGRLTSGATGRAWKMSRDDETAARAVGVSVTHYKVLAFAIGCMLCGFAGSVYGHFLRLRIARHVQAR